MLPLLLACTPAHPIPEGCQPYTDPGVQGFCIASLAGGFEDVARCEAAGRWAPQCQTIWVEARLPPDSGTTTQALLSACPDADCRLDVLDFRADPALLVQLERCGAWAADNAPHCVSHAV